MSKRSNDFSLPLAKKSLATPPSTPQKSRIRDISNILTNTTNNKNNASRKLSFITPPTTPTKAKQSSIYSKAKALFQRSSAQDYNPNDVIGGGSALIGRLEEANFLNAFLMESIDLKNRQACTYQAHQVPGKQHRWIYRSSLSRLSTQNQLRLLRLIVCQFSNRKIFSTRFTVSWIHQGRVLNTVEKRHPRIC